MSMFDCKCLDDVSLEKLKACCWNGREADNILAATILKLAKKLDSVESELASIKTRDARKRVMQSS